LPHNLRSPNSNKHMQQIKLLTIVGLFTCAAAAHAGTYTVTTTASDGPGSFSQAIRDADADPGSTIAFNIAGAGPHYIVPPMNGFPLIIADGTTVDGTTQPGWAANTAPITATNNAQIKIVLDARGLGAGYFRDMAYVFYNTNPVALGYGSLSDPVIDNSSMAGLAYAATNLNGNGYERGGFTPTCSGLNTNTGDCLTPDGIIAPPYSKGEIAILGVYRAQNVTVKGIAFLGSGDPDLGDYNIAVALDYGFDTTVHNVPNTDVGRWTYDNGSSRGFKCQGCWFGVDPSTGSETNLAESGIAAFRHRDKGTGGTRPELANGENFIIGVEPGAVNPRAQFNVFTYRVLALAWEAARARISGNQFLEAPVEIGRYNDTTLPWSVLFGTDGDGVNDADEGNLFSANGVYLGSGYQSHYSTSAKVWRYGGNYFGLNRDGSYTTAAPEFIEDTFRFDQGSQVLFGSDFDGVSDALEANFAANTGGFAVNANAANAAAWISLRRNMLTNNPFMPLPEAQSVYSLFMSTPNRPVITAATASSMTVTYGMPTAATKRVFVDLYKSDPAGDLFNDPCGMTYLGTYEDTTLDGTVTWPTPPYSSTDTITVAIHYAKSLASASQPQITGIVTTNVIGNAVITWTGSSYAYDIQRASSIYGPWGSVGRTASTTFATPISGVGVPSTAFLRIVAGKDTDGQTSPFAFSQTIP